MSSARLEDTRLKKKKSMAFLGTRNKQFKSEIKKATTFRIASKK